MNKWMVRWVAEGSTSCLEAKTDWLSVCSCCHISCLISSLRALFPHARLEATRGQKQWSWGTALGHTRRRYSGLADDLLMAQESPFATSPSSSLPIQTFLASKLLSAFQVGNLQMDELIQANGFRYSASGVNSVFILTLQSYHRPGGAAWRVGVLRENIQTLGWGLLPPSQAAFQGGPDLVLLCLWVSL